MKTFEGPSAGGLLLLAAALAPRVSACSICRPARRPDVQRARRRDLHTRPVPPRARRERFDKENGVSEQGCDGDRRPRRRDREPVHAERGVLVRRDVHDRRADSRQRSAPRGIGRGGPGDDEHHRALGSRLHRSLPRWGVALQAGPRSAGLGLHRRGREDALGVGQTTCPRTGNARRARAVRNRRDRRLRRSFGRRADRPDVLHVRLDPDRRTGSNDDDHQYGRTTTANVADERKLGAAVDAVLEANWRHAEQDIVDADGNRDPNTGGDVVYVTPRAGSSSTSVGHPRPRRHPDPRREEPLRRPDGGANVNVGLTVLFEIESRRP